jgi:DNA-directed RNA polymerase subunit M/transcription elongation factor TFIIS
MAFNLWECRKCGRRYHISDKINKSSVLDSLDVYHGFDVETDAHCEFNIGMEHRCRACGVAGEIYALRQIEIPAPLRQYGETFKCAGCGKPHRITATVNYVIDAEKEVVESE